MSTIQIAANPAEFGNGFVRVKLALGAPSPYREVIEATKMEEVVAAVHSARAALAGQNMALSVRVLSGRKPNGFDAWKAANRALLEVRAE